MTENRKTLCSFERHTFDRVKEMVNDASRKLGKSWRLDYGRVRIETNEVVSTVSVYEGDYELYRSCFCDNVAEACMYIVAFLNGINTALDMCKPR